VQAATDRGCSSVSRRKEGKRMKEIPLSQGYVALVNNEDYEELNRFKWTALVCRSAHRLQVYAYRNIKINGKVVTTLLMHRVLLGVECPKEVDHRDGNGINNQRYNLRACTRSQNCGNARHRPGGTSPWRGVSWSTERKKWLAVIFKDGKRRQLGRFKHEYNAAQAYNFAAEELFGEFARLNVPLEREP
jgi:hypothetical protein